MAKEIDGPLVVTVTRPPGWRARERQLEHARLRYEHGNLLGLYDGLCLCRDADLPLPQWLLEGVQEFMRESLLDGIKGKKGRGNRPLGASLKARRSDIRVRMVAAIRFVQEDRKNWGHLPEPMMSKFLSGKITQFGSTIEDACQLAHISLRGTPAQASARTFRDEYEKRNRKFCDVLIQDALPETLAAFELSFPKEFEGNWVPDWVDTWVATGEKPVES